MINPLDEQQLGALHTDIERSDQSMAAFRRKRVQLIQQQLGRHHPGGTSDEEPIALGFLSQAKAVYGQEFASKLPVTIIMSERPQLKARAAVMQSKVKNLLREIHFQITLSDLVDDAMDFVGIRKIGVERTFLNEELGIFHDANQPFFERVSPDDLIIDMDATRIDRLLYIGDRYKVPLDDAKDNDAFHKEAREQLTKSDSTLDSPGGVPKAGDLGKQRVGMRSDELEPMVELADVWLPREQLVITIAPKQPNILLNDVDWDGPERGPYAFLGFGRVPDQVFPCSPLSLIRDLHELANAIFRKVSNQAESQKNVGITQRGDEEDATTLKEAKDGELLGLTNTTNVNKLSVGGVDPSNVLFVQQAIGLLDRLTGLSTAAGTAPAADTATQEVLLAQRASARMAKYQDTTQEFARDAVEDLAWYWYHNPDMDMSGDLPIPYTNSSVHIPLTIRERREADFLQYNFTIQACSMRHMTADEHRALLRQFLQDFSPFMQQMEMQGISIDFAKFIDLYASYANAPEIKEVLTAAVSRELQGQQAQEEPRQAAHTIRENVRINKPAGRGQEDSLGGMAGNVASLLQTAQSRS